MQHLPAISGSVGVVGDLAVSDLMGDLTIPEEVQDASYLLNNGPSERLSVARHGQAWCRLP